MCATTLSLIQPYAVRAFQPAHQDLDPPLALGACHVGLLASPPALVSDRIANMMQAWAMQMQLRPELASGKLSCYYVIRNSQDWP